MSGHVPNHISEREFARMFNLTISGARGWRKRGYGPAAVKFGKLVYYRTEDVAGFIAESGAT